MEGLLRTSALVSALRFVLRSFTLPYTVNSLSVALKVTGLVKSVIRISFSLSNRPLLLVSTHTSVAVGVLPSAVRVRVVEAVLAERKTI